MGKRGVVAHDAAVPSLAGSDLAGRPPATRWPARASLPAAPARRSRAAGRAAKQGAAGQARASTAREAVEAHTEMAVAPAPPDFAAEQDAAEETTKLHEGMDYCRQDGTHTWVRLRRSRATPRPASLRLSFIHFFARAS